MLFVSCEPALMSAVLTEKYQFPLGTNHFWSADFCLSNVKKPFATSTVETGVETENPSAAETTIGDVKVIALSTTALSNKRRDVFDVLIMYNNP